MKIYLRLLSHVRPYVFRIVMAGIFGVGVSGLTALYAWLVRPVLDGVFINKEAKLLLIVPLAILATALLKGICSYGQAYLMYYVGCRAILDLRSRVYRHSLHLPLGYYNKNASGQLISNVTNDINLLQSTLSVGIKDVFQQSLTILALAGVILYQNWKLAVLAFVVLPVAYYPLVRFGKRLREISRSGQATIADLTVHLQETYGGIRLIKAYRTEEMETDRLNRIGFKYFRNNMKRVQIMETSSPLMEFIGALGVAFIIWYGGFQVIQGVTTPGTFFSFMTACLFMYGPVRNLSVTYNSLQQSLAAADRLFHIIDYPTEKEIDKGAIELTHPKGTIAFRNVGFRYEGSSQPALENINVRADKGDIIALVGESGSGKTTLVNLIPRFYELDEGSIEIDGVDSRKVTLSSLRAQIGMVTQEIILFDDTVQENISYGLTGISPDAIISAAKMAYADAFISKLPEGYQTRIGERGANLSGGERQRLAIARAILRDPPFLILDEATSSLDSESEFMVQQALSSLMKNRTSFVIAHRLSTVQNATRILVMERGRIAESGTHSELLGRDGLYRKLYDRQFKETPQ